MDNIIKQLEESQNQFLLAMRDLTEVLKEANDALVKVNKDMEQLFADLKLLSASEETRRMVEHLNG